MWEFLLLFRPQLRNVIGYSAGLCVRRRTTTAAATIKSKWRSKSFSELRANRIKKDFRRRFSTVVDASTTTTTNSLSSTTPSSSSSPSLDSAYTSNQREEILKLLNRCCVEEIRLYDVTKQRATHLVKHRTKFGDFAKLDDVLEVEGFSVRFLQSLCDSVLYGLSEDSKRHQNSARQHASSPSVNEELRQVMQNVVSLQLFPQEVVWLNLSRDMAILEWEHMPLGIGTRSYNHNLNFELSRRILSRLPKADAYLFEQRTLRSSKQTNGGGGGALHPFLLGLLQLESMLSALLNERHATPELGGNAVFVVRQSIVGRFFSLKLGNEKISGQKVVGDILRGTHCMDLRRVQVDPPTLLWYKKQTDDVREKLANSFLQAVAFYELEIVRKSSPLS